ncbi:hypothetical protein DOTSEDRAFT_167754 [Dothistroma septosporum NZE10]|uniref:CID domain-containing protein n=1 Tax=Dothistroma septosporum (strain NZE10 / CBS 128990) TaxID=675120 RepID=N1Q111_DOTSN|nr:hypothetical protein DOTSEDRAFT_167754 [Dothistroma septosporum NZE10]
MSSRSPRGSISGASTSAEVAADFEDALKDLQGNNRYEISNLTIIAKENTEYAQAISQVLENHIKTTPASRKLPAFYVLDSIVKNVGTPYTVYLGRDLYRTFMDAYTLVDGTTRKAMEGLMKTWKEPVPGSLDPRPVFPLETVRPIENALIKARTAVLQSRQPQVPYRGNMPTPPQHNGQFSTPPHPFPSQPYPAYSVTRDIQLLIPRFQQMLASNPGDSRIRSQLGALQQLLNILQSRALSPPEFQAVHAQVTTLSGQLPAQQPAPPQPQPAAPIPQWQQPLTAPFVPPYQTPQQSQYPCAPYQFPAPPQLPAQATGASPAIPTSALSNLQALLANVQKPSTPQMRAAIPEIRNATHSQLHSIQNQAAAAPNTNGAANLLAALSKAGIINTAPPASAPAPQVPPPATAPPNLDFLKSLQSILPPVQSGTSSQIPGVAPAQTINAASIRVHRPELVHALYDAQPNQCTQCGRRFLATDEGREKKSRHLDWHFRTNQRIADPNLNRGHHRNWYVDEMEWIKHTEFDPSTTTATAQDAAAAAKAKDDPQQKSVRAPVGMTRNTCNICQEDMNSQYSDEFQDWIFANATVHNGRIVHATCLAEMTKPALGASSAGSFAAALANVGGGGYRERSATPDSLKRKAETAMDGGGARLKMA